MPAACDKNRYNLFGEKRMRLFICGSSLRFRPRSIPSRNYNKKKVFDETYRVLKPKGRLAISDIVLLKNLPEKIQNSVEAYVGCISGAILKDRYLQLIKDAGYIDVTVIDEISYQVNMVINKPRTEAFFKETGVTEEEFHTLGGYFVSIKVIGKKP